MDTKQAQRLIQKYIDGECNAEEKGLFESWYNQAVQDRPDPMLEPNYKVLQERLAASLPAGKKIVRLRLGPRIAAVAAAVIGIALCVYFFNAPSHHPDTGQDPALAMNDIAPGKNGATLTLANGKVIRLSDTKGGVIIGDDKFAYNDGSAVGPLSASGREPSSRAQRDQNTTNTSSYMPEGQRGGSVVAKTTRGQTYEFTLPDGTKVWLNASSKLHIPSSFFGTETRKLKLEGEAYFEVFKDRKRPFVVETAGNDGRPGQEVTVLGTHFNISSYADESSIKTTLLEGSVSVAKTTPATPPLLAKEEAVILKPNQQSVVSGPNRIDVKEIDPTEAVAWKNGDFVFKGERLESAMRQISRWYDIDVIYADNLPKDVVFWGYVSRSRKLSVVLKQMENTRQVKFKIEGKTVSVTR